MENEKIERRKNYTAQGISCGDEEFLDIAVGLVNVLCSKYDIQRYEAFEIAKQSYLLRIAESLRHIDNDMSNLYAKLDDISVAAGGIESGIQGIELLMSSRESD